MPLPVVTGIGHERDRVAADEVAHTAAPTPTAAAELLCRIMRTAEQEVATAAEAILQFARRRMESQKDALKASIRSLTDQSNSLSLLNSSKPVPIVINFSLMLAARWMFIPRCLRRLPELSPWSRPESCKRRTARSGTWRNKW